MKEIYFLSGMPRSGNTLLGSLINQNEEITVTGSSIVCSILYSISLLKEEMAFSKWLTNYLHNNVKGRIKSYYQTQADMFILNYGWETKYD
jgi:hypothetical protein